MSWNGSARTDPVATWATHALAAEAFRLVLQTFDQEGVDVLPVKGIVLAHSLYGSPEERPMADIDLRVRPRDLRRVTHIARAQRWPAGPKSGQLGAVGFWVSRTLVEVESTIGPPGVCAIGVDEMLARSSWQTGSLGVRHREPELHDHALLLCVNVFKDKLLLAPPWAREDLLRISSAPDFRPETVAVRATSARLRTLVGIVADWLSADARGGQWARVRAAVEPRRRAYAALYDTLARWAPRSAAMGLVARAASDSALLRAKALALGVLGAATAAVSRE